MFSERSETSSLVTKLHLHLHLHLVIWQTLLSKATYNWGIHKAIHLEEAIRQRKLKNKNVSGKMFHDKSRFCANILRTLLKTRLLSTNFLLTLLEELFFSILLRTLAEVLLGDQWPAKAVVFKEVTRRGRIPPTIIDEQAEFDLILFIEGTCDICHI